MKKETKKLGRPPKKDRGISFWAFKRACLAMSSFHEVRESGEKHSAAVTQTVEWIKQRDPIIRISETEVRRILARWRPRGSHIILRFQVPHASCGRTSEVGTVQSLNSTSVPEKKDSELPEPSEMTPYPNQSRRIKCILAKDRIIPGTTASSRRHNFPSWQDFFWTQMSLFYLFFLWHAGL